MRPSDDPSLGGTGFLRSNWELVDQVASDQSGGVPVPPQERPYAAGAATIDLAPPGELTLGSMPVRQAIAARRSRRSFGHGSLAAEELSFLLWATQGITKHTPKWSLRTVPSAGCRHPLETFVAAFRVDGVAPGLWRYHPVGHRLARMPADPDRMTEELGAALLGQLFGCAVAFLWTAVPYRTGWRYPMVFPKLVALDAGHLCQNLYLACEAIGCGTCALGAYDQQQLDRFLRVDGEQELAVYAAVVGRLVVKGPG